VSIILIALGLCPENRGSAPDSLHATPVRQSLTAHRAAKPRSKEDGRTIESRKSLASRANAIVKVSPVGDANDCCARSDPHRVCRLALLAQASRQTSA